MSFTDLAYCAGCLGAVGVRGDVSALKWDGACADGACADGAYLDGACLNKACPGGACIDGACPGGACTDGACADGACCGACCGAWGTGWDTAAWGTRDIAYSCPLLEFPQELNFF